MQLRVREYLCVFYLPAIVSFITVPISLTPVSLAYAFLVVHLIQPTELF